MVRGQFGPTCRVSLVGALGRGRDLAGCHGLAQGEQTPIRATTPRSTIALPRRWLADLLSA
jgi:hypothetical protein